MNEPDDTDPLVRSFLAHYQFETIHRCHGEMRLIACLTDPASNRALVHLGEPATPPPLAPRARAPPVFDTEPLPGTPATPGFAIDQSPNWEPTAAPPDPGYPFDQSLD
jgi:hypothetical protein